MLTVGISGLPSTSITEMLPRQYPVTYARNGARHRIADGPRLGNNLDIERDGQPSDRADKDDRFAMMKTVSISARYKLVCRMQRSA